MRLLVRSLACAFCAVVVAWGASSGPRESPNRPDMTSLRVPETVPHMYDITTVPSAGEPEPVSTTSTTIKEEAPALEVPRPTSNVLDDAQLMRIAACEQPGSGEGGVYWTHHGPVYEGGPGFAASTWDAVRDPEWADNAGDASVAQQLEGMRRVLVRWPTAWATCRQRVGV